MEKVVGWRNFLMAGAVGGSGMLLPQAFRQSPAYAAPVHGHGSGDTEVTVTPPLKKYVDPLPRPVTAIPDTSAYPGADYYELTMRH
ncbi:hypothetical protein F8568_002015 [Actinomadura sp. LD22]|uniref:Uncharacterized protein n=1 Tax=Actinomadura physcomitrii TaxID=2650748 RepID=A0A6I4M5X9_9ACTN|nr:hypothetical protein [Actinomadura physcomitrii]MVZ99180.1 hypothetical protein [Actinomadura physcomitrii]